MSAVNDFAEEKPDLYVRDGADAMWRNCRAFLMSDKPYVWPHVHWQCCPSTWRFSTVVGLLAFGVAGVVALTCARHWGWFVGAAVLHALAIRHTARHNRWNRSNRTALKGFGADLEHWPFADWADLRAAAQPDEPHQDPQVNPPARDAAARLIDGFLAGDLPVADLRERWPPPGWDAGVRAVAEELLPLLPKGESPHPPAGSPAAVLVDALERCRLFLRSNLPYRHGHLRRESPWPLLLAGVVLLGGAVPVGFLVGMLMLPIFGPAGLLAAGVGAWLWCVGCLLLLPRWSRRAMDRRFRKRLASGDLVSWPFANQADLTAARQGDKEGQTR